jgi:glycosyltransferase involved in cell wall biosynthesis
MSRLRIVHVLNNLAMGGAERVALNLALAQAVAGHQPRVYCIDGEGELATQARAAGIEVKNFSKGPGVRLWTALRIAASMWRDKLDVVHTHNPSAHYYGAVAALLARVPVLVNTRHSPVSSRGAEYRECYFRWLLPITDSVVFVSDHARKAVEAKWGPGRCLTCTIPNGIPISQFRAQPARPGCSRPRITFGTLGRLAPVKGHEFLIRAFGKVSEQACEAKLQIVGGGPLEAKLQQQIADQGLSDRIRILAPTHDVAGVLSGLDVFVISSLSEGLPMVVLEAMAAGLPIVSTRVGGIPEVVPEGTVAWFCDPGDVEGMAQAMLAAMRCPQLAERGRAAAELAVSSYNSAQMAGRYDALFFELLSKKRGV